MATNFPSSTAALVAALGLASGCSDYDLSGQLDAGESLDDDSRDGDGSGSDGGGGSDDTDGPASPDPGDGGGGSASTGPGSGSGSASSGDAAAFADCLTLAEAWDLGDLSARFTGGAHVLTNRGSDDICMDDWYAFFSDDSQDAGLGESGIGSSADRRITLRPGEAQAFGYIGSSAPAWFCIEETQITEETTNFHFFGARVPEPLRGAMEGGRESDQESVWDDIALGPVALVGRAQNVVDLDVGDNVEVEVEVLNLGRAPVTTTITETVPSWFEIVDAGAATVTRNSDGSSTLAWTLSLDGAIDTPTNRPTDYDVVLLPYEVRLQRCPGDRTLSGRPGSQYQDGQGTWRKAEGSPLVTRCTP